MIVLEKTLLEALALVHENILKAKLFLKDKRLSFNEKEILKCWLLLRESHPEKIILTLNKITGSLSPLMIAQKNLIWGITLNNQGHFKESTFKLRDALDDFQKLSLNEYIFMAGYNLFIASYNLYSLPEMKYSLLQMANIPLEYDGQRISLLQIKLLMSIAENKINDGAEFITELEKLKAKMSEPIVVSYLVSKFRYEVCADKLKDASLTLCQMKKHRKFSLSGNYTYMKTLLGFLTEDRPIYAYKDKFKNCMYLFWHLMVIEALQRGDNEEAEKYWYKLRDSRPEIYSISFEYRGEKSLFSLALNRFSQFPATLSTRPSLQSFNTKEQHLIFLLESSATPVPMKLIFKEIWNIDQVEFGDQDKIKKLVSRVRKKYGLEIHYKKGCYYLISSKTLPKSG